MGVCAYVASWYVVECREKADTKFSVGGVFVSAFWAKIGDISTRRRHVADMSPTFPAKDTASEVSSGVFDVAHSNKFESPENFKQLLWNIAGPSPGSMTIMLELLKDDLEDNQAGLPADFKQIPPSILEYMVSEAGEDRGDQIKFIKEIMEAMEQIAQSNNHSKASLDKGGGQQQEASKTQGTLTGAQEASPTEEAAIEPAMAGRDKEGAQSLSMVPTG